MLALMQSGAILREVSPTAWLEVLPEVFTTPTDGWEYEDYTIRTIQDAGVPSGHRAVSSSLIVVGGVPTRTYVTEPLETEIPYEISRKQFYMELAVSYLITKAEALAAIGIGQLPAALRAIVDGMSNEAAKWEAEMQLVGANGFYRDSPWVLVVATVLGWTEEQIDAFWIAAEKH